ncbi:hypothetical protein FRC03_008002, partial [Tulasnella sp. 419]
MEASSETGPGPNRPRDPHTAKSPWKWEDHFGRKVDKDHPIWSKYVEVAAAHDNDVIGEMNRSMDIILVFSGLFSAVVTTFIVQVEQALATWDPAEYTAKLLQVMFRNQTNVLLHILDPSLELPTIDDYEEEYLPDVRITVLLWYISLELALLVAGGAVCVKMWLMEYRRSNRRHSLPYYRAIHHQRTYSSLRRWYIPELCDLLGTILLLDLVPFFSGLMFHSTLWRTGDWVFWDAVSFILGVYSCFLA